MRLDRFLSSLRFERKFTGIGKRSIQAISNSRIALKLNPTSLYTVFSGLDKMVTGSKLSGYQVGTNRQPAALLQPSVQQKETKKTKPSLRAT